MGARSGIGVSVGVTLAVQPVLAAQVPPAPGVSVALLSKLPLIAVVPVRVKLSFSLALMAKLMGAVIGAAGQLPLAPKIGRAHV